MTAKPLKLISYGVFVLFITISSLQVSAQAADQQEAQTEAYLIIKIKTSPGSYYRKLTASVTASNKDEQEIIVSEFDALQDKILASGEKLFHYPTMLKFIEFLNMKGYSLLSFVPVAEGGGGLNSVDIFYVITMKKNITQPAQ